MVKPKLKRTLTKIDPSILKQKLPAISQHATDSGSRVTTTVEPVLPPIIQDPLLDPTFFGADVSDVGEGSFEDGGGDDGVSGGYYVARVRISLLPPFTWKLIAIRTTHSSYGGLNVIFTSRSSYDSKGKEYSLTMVAANSAARKACIAALIVKRSDSSVRVA